VSVRVPAAHERGEERIVEAAVEVDVRDRWDALALSELLIPFHSFLVQHTAEHWVVHARCPGCHGEPLAAALAAIEEWRDERETAAAVRVDGRPQRPRR
jgi:hypothetical protein